ncbi:unnamed protein product [Paramecium primaurelia]|uniref:Uncharacterized protein n=1 Tax=Paramecium primaurelia TaxID=5886 RepID=A0A8S1JP15_PARPR|nr:unnamed protein product [Paramecium primaurelia]
MMVYEILLIFITINQLPSYINLKTNWFFIIIYLSLDGINCGYCFIDNFEYCFEYVYDNNNNIIVSIDINREYIQLDNYEIHLGCAQCYKGYYYSFQTNKCELLSQHMQQCDIAIQLYSNSKIQCLKTQSLINSIQNIYCENIPLCLQCIHNYSQTINSFLNTLKIKNQIQVKSNNSISILTALDFKQSIHSNHLDSF